MREIAIAIFLASLPIAFAILAVGERGARYAIVRNGELSVWRVDTRTGAIELCESVGNDQVVVHGFLTPINCGPASLPDGAQAK